MTTLNVWFSQTKHVSGKINKHDVQIWGSQNSYEVVKKERDSSKLNVWQGLMHNQIIGPFIFAESTITVDIYLEMLKHYIVLLLVEFQPWVMFQQDCTTPQWNLMICYFLNETFPN